MVIDEVITVYNEKHKKPIYTKCYWLLKQMEHIFTNRF
jgi:hypothetical protein